MIKKNKISVGTHDGVFHADDLLCVAMLMYVYGKSSVEIIRSRDTDVLFKCDYVVDVGNKDEITDEHVFLDHHQPDSQYYDNGIKMAACGKLATYLFGDDKDFLNFLREDLLYPIEATDNGQELSSFGLLPSKLYFTSILNKTWNESQDKDYEYFLHALDIVYDIFVHEVKSIKSKIVAKDIFDEIYNKTDLSTGMLVMDEYIPWKQFIQQKNKENAEQIRIVVFRATDGTWYSQGVPENSDGISSLTNTPPTWRGYRDEDLRKVCQIDDAIFCHPNGFLTVFKSKEAAILGAKKVLSYNNVLSIDNTPER